MLACCCVVFVCFKYMYQVADSDLPMPTVRALQDTDFRSSKMSKLLINAKPKTDAAKVFSARWHDCQISLFIAVTFRA